MLEFKVDVGGTADCAVVSVSGELDIATAPALVAALDDVLTSDPERVVVDLLKTSFIDSTGLTTLLRVHKQREARGNGAFSLLCGPDNVEVRRVIDLMGFDEVFTLHESLAAAGCDDG